MHLKEIKKDFQAKTLLESILVYLHVLEIGIMMKN